jgi:GNAT superfamily N-acetyltransferase
MGSTADDGGRAPALSWPPERCPSCHGDVVVSGSLGERCVCQRCGRCWEQGPVPADGTALREVDTLACSGCGRRVVCESRPTWLVAAQTTVDTLRDGTPVLIRPLLYSDRTELSERYEQLSPESRRLRFFGAPDHLSTAQLEYLTNVDQVDHAALGAWLLTEGTPGAGVARYIRLRDEPTVAEAAVTVVDELHGRGLGTLLLRRLADWASQRGILSFVTYALWDNVPVLEGLTQAGARVSPAEPGVARLEVDLPGPEDDITGTALHRALRLVAAQSSAIHAP